jgi:hypothetical protein
MPWRTATWWVTQQSTKCTGWAGCCWTANFTFASKEKEEKVCKFNTPALNGRKKFHLQKTKLNDEIKKLFDNFEQKDLPRTMREHFLKKWKKLWTKWYPQITHKNRSHDHDAVGLGRCEHKPSVNQKGNLHLHDIGSYVPKDKV